MGCYERLRVSPFLLGVNERPFQVDTWERRGEESVQEQHELITMPHRPSTAAP